MFDLFFPVICPVLLLSCRLAWPILRRRSYVAAAAVSCLVPTLLWVFYPSLGTSWEVSWRWVLARIAFLTACLIPLLSCMLAWPILRRRRVYVVAAAVLCLTPLWTSYGPGWGWGRILPLVLALPGYVIYLGAPWELFVYMVLPVGVPIGVVTWLLCRRFLPPPNPRGGGSLQEASEQ